jgi:predicted HTH transcriptional regulator
MSELKRIIAQGEGLCLDFKYRIDDQRKIARTLAAFANTRGGKLLIGVKDSGKVVGCDPEEEFYMVDGAASVFCNPPVHIESKVWKEDHYLVLEVNVPVADAKHKAKDENGDWKFYHRLEDQTLLVNRIEILIWKFKKEGNQRPEVFDDDVMNLIQLIEEHQPITISKLFRKSDLNKNKVNQLIETLVYWRVVNREILSAGIGYSIRK